MNSKIENFLENAHLKEFVKNAKLLENKDRPAFLISFNVSDDLETFKIYYEIDRQYSNDTIKKFLPTEKDFVKFIPYWNKERESSLCFGIKIDKKLNPIQYFHIKFDPLKKIYLDYPEFKKPKFFDRSYDLKTETGVSFEYQNNSSIQKNYFYFHTLRDKVFISSKFNVPFENVNHFEYTEFSDKNKVIAVHDNYFTPDKCVKTYLLSLNNSKINDCVRYFEEKYNLAPEFYGVYENNKIIAIYWSLTTKQHLHNIFS